MQTVTCPACGGSNDVEPNEGTHGVCSDCGEVHSVETWLDEDGPEPEWPCEKAEMFTPSEGEAFEWKGHKNSVIELSIPPNHIKELIENPDSLVVKGQENSTIKINVPLEKVQAIVKEKDEEITRLKRIIRQLQDEVDWDDDNDM